MQSYIESKQYFSMIRGKTSLLIEFKEAIRMKTFYVTYLTQQEIANCTKKHSIDNFALGNELNFNYLYFPLEV